MEMWIPRRFKEYKFGWCVYPKDGTRSKHLFCLHCSYINANAARRRNSSWMARPENGFGWSFSTGSWTLMNLSCGKRNGVVICPSTWHVPNLFRSPKCCQAEGSKEDFLKDFFKTFKATRCVKPRNSISFKGLKVWTNCHRIRSTARQECFGLLGMKIDSWSPSLHCELVQNAGWRAKHPRCLGFGERRGATGVLHHRATDRKIKKDMKWQGWYELNRIYQRKFGWETSELRTFKNA